MRPIKLKELVKMLQQHMDAGRGNLPVYISAGHGAIEGESIDEVNPVGDLCDYHEIYHDENGNEKRRKGIYLSLA